MAEHGFTPGPWEWYGNARNREIYLATKHSGRRYVMGFRRWGMSGAQPMFQPGDRGLVAADQLLTFEVGDKSVRGVEQAKADESVYRLDISGIDCADARLIAASPTLREALEGMIQAHNRALQNWRQGLADAQESGNRALAVEIQNGPLCALASFPVEAARAAITLATGKDA